MKEEAPTPLIPRYLRGPLQEPLLGGPLLPLPEGVTFERRQPADTSCPHYRAARPPSTCPGAGAEEGVLTPGEGLLTLPSDPRLAGPLTYISYIYIL